MKISTLTVLALNLVLAPFAMAATTPPVSGMLITQVNSQQWQIRLITADTVERFSGIMESDQPITGALKVSAFVSISARESITRRPQPRQRRPTSAPSR
jgi:hypothetical protein